MSTKSSLPAGSHGLRKTKGARVLKRKPGPKKGSTKKAGEKRKASTMKKPSAKKQSVLSARVAPILAGLTTRERTFLSRGGLQFAALKPTQRNAIKNVAEALKDDKLSTRQINSFVRRRTGAKKSSSKKKGKSAGEKRPLSSFMLFAQENRKKVKDTHPEQSPKQLASLLGSLWRDMKEANSAQYQEYVRRAQKKE